ncbi:MAG: DUF480 domain-containing protein [Planctomycetaceae bacterium]
MTLKGLTTGCNQKSNRSPLTDYSEDSVYDTLEQLRELGLTAVVHTESGRTERFRHYVRKCYDFTEPQLAILTELLLRGRQTLGELRARASRMVPIDSLTDLRNELDSLLDQGYLQATADLERRGTEVDHTFYGPQENKDLEVRSANSAPASPTSSSPAPATSAPVLEESSPAAPTSSSRDTVTPTEDLAELKLELEDIRTENEVLKSSLQQLEDQVSTLAEQVTEMRRELGM